MNEHYLNALRLHDTTLPARAAGISPSFLEDVARNWQSFDSQSRSIALSTAAAMPNPVAGRFLQSVSGLRGEPAAVQAAAALFHHPHAPEGASLLTTAANVPDPAVRTHLYRAAGVRNGPVSQLEQRYKDETDEDAKLAARDSMARLGHVPSLRAIFRQTLEATAGDVMDVQDSLLFVEDKRLAKAMVPWLLSEDAVTRLSSDRSPAMIRQCDYGVWIAYRLKTGVVVPVSHIDNYAHAVIAAAKPVLQRLPDIEE
ncbi:MAG: hypothetical protein FJW30_19600 [Acidobacteria bacterium]|nr:hypothetical protein [Acidobacteriota bacterium]